ncbi:hypothetical protein [Algiphilus sp.]|uniref:hypothetical protein n=1 Tax=Algiphilus sp. TaxID=1872431 RepID=UPI001CA67D56|nr:hypothetical protein [Algiphilus sp.]MBY8966786.1 hypothetical protein [Algiphilus acroporae]MCI5061598.1 hypothetical protein [Algiphilus sp.]MCI5104093.1 hypothetical protein [Algiphilus sp.]
MKRWHRITMIALCGLWASTAVAQDGPAIDTSGGNLGGALSDGAGAEADAPADGAQQPALDTGSAGGTSVIGDTESPIGLYIIPWRSTSPTPQLDRPARFVDATEEPVDEIQFRRFVEYHEALTRHRAAQQGAADRTSQ